MASTTTLKDVNDYLLSDNNTTTGTRERKMPTGAQQFGWITYSPKPTDHYNEVFPSIILGDKHISQDTEALIKLGITHVVNCACGKKFNQIDTDAQYFQESGIKFHGIAATNMIMYKMAPHFNAAVDFMDDALSSGGKIYIHCRSGESRSATIVLAYLILKQNIDLMDAIKCVRDKRKIIPNDGFLTELATLNTSLHEQTE